MTSEKFEFLVSGKLAFDFCAGFCPFLLVVLCQWWAEKCNLREQKAPDPSFPSEDLSALPCKRVSALPFPSQTCGNTKLRAKAFHRVSCAIAFPTSSSQLRVSLAGCWLKAAGKAVLRVAVSAVPSGS